MRLSRDESGEMRHVDHQIGADLVRDRAEAGKIDDPRIGTAPAMISRGRCCSACRSTSS